MPRELKITETNLEGFKTIYDDFQLRPGYYEQHERSDEFLKVVDIYQRHLDTQKVSELPYQPEKAELPEDITFTPTKDFIPTFKEPTEPAQAIQPVQISNMKPVQAGTIIDYSDGRFPVKERKMSALKAATNSFIQGSYQFVDLVGGALMWSGINEEAGKRIREFSKEVSAEYKVSALEKGFEWSDLKFTDFSIPEFYYTKGVRMIPMLVALIPTALAGGAAGATVATALGAGRIVISITAAVTSALASRPLESSMEAIGTYNELIDQGVDKEKAGEAAADVFINNMALIGMDAAQYALAFARVPIALRGPMSNWIVRSGVKAVGFAAASASEGYEEVIQNYFADLGKASVKGEVKPDLLKALLLASPSDKEAFALGTLAGAGLQSAGLFRGEGVIDGKLSEKDLDRIINEQIIVSEVIEPGEPAEVRERKITAAINKGLEEAGLGVELKPEEKIEITKPIVEPVIEKPIKKEPEKAEVKPKVEKVVEKEVIKPVQPIERREVAKPKIKKPEKATTENIDEFLGQEVELGIFGKDDTGYFVEKAGEKERIAPSQAVNYVNEAITPKIAEKPKEAPIVPKVEEKPVEAKPPAVKPIIEPTIKADKKFFADIVSDVEKQIEKRINKVAEKAYDSYLAAEGPVFKEEVETIKYKGENFTIENGIIKIETPQGGKYEYPVPTSGVDLKAFKKDISEAFKREAPLKVRVGVIKRKPVLESLKVLQDKTAPPERIETAKAFLREKGIGFRGKNVFGESSGYTDTGGYTDVGGYHSKENKTLRAVALPELVGIAKDLVGGKVPIIKKRLRGAKGTALGAMLAYEGGKIELRADIFENPDLAAKVLAHEIGHIVDYLPERTMKRGNILGRIASLKNHMKPLLEGTEFKNKEIIEELRQLTRTWKPDSPIKGYTSKELYADAISVLFNDPALLKRVAPKFNEAFFGYLGRKPSFKFAYESIQKAIEDGSVLETRQKDIEEMIDESERKQRELEKEERTGFGDIMNAVKKELVDHNATLIKMVKKDIKDGKQIKAENNPVFWAEELPYISSETNQYLRDVVNKIKNPAKKAGLTNKDIGIYMFLYRVATERGKLANPKGYTPTEANKQLEFMHRKLGDVKFNKLKDLAKDFNNLRQERVVSLLEKSGMYDQGLIELIKINDGYATFQVQKYMENKYGRGVAKVIMPQIGTFQDIANPFAATLIKDQSIIYATNVTEIKKNLVKWLVKDHPTEISEAETKFVITGDGKGYHQPLPSKNPKEGMITYLQGGKVISYYVPKDIAETFERDPFDAGLVVRFGEKLTRPLKEIFVGRNPFWMLWNIQRDTKAWAKQLPVGTLPKMIKYLWKSKGDAFKDVFLHKSTKDVADMYRNKMLIIDRQWRSLETSPEDQIDRILQDVATDEVKHHNIVVKPIIWFWQLLSDIGKYSERIVKISGYKYLSDLAINEKEAAHLVRKRAGSPDFLAGGTHRRLYNTLFLFSNAAVQGIRGAYEAAVDNPASYAYKTIKYDLIPKTLMYYYAVIGAALAAAGLISEEKEDELKLIMDRIPDRDKENYICVPLGLTETGKAVYFIIPHDFQGQVIGGLFWDLLNAKKPDDIRDMVDYMSGQLPYSSVNPLLGESAKWISYSSKKNPYNSWTGRNVLSDDAFAALPKDSKYAREEMWKDTWNSLGGSVVHRFKTDNYGEIQSELEKILDIPIASGFFRRFIRVSNWGEREKYKEVAADVRAEKAIGRLEFKPVLRKMVVGDELSPEEMQILTNNLDWLVTKTGKPTQNLIKFIGKGSANAFIAEYMTAMSNDEKVAIMQKYMEINPKK